MANTTFRCCTTFFLSWDIINITQNSFLKGYNSLGFSLFARLCNYHYCLIPEHFHCSLPNKTLHPPEISHFPLQICSPPVLCVLRPVYTTSTGPQALWLWVRLGQWGTSKEIRERRVKTHIYFSGSLTEQLTQAGWDLYMERSFLRSFMLDNSLSSWLLVSPPPLLCY